MAKKKLVDSGSIYQSMSLTGNTIELTFTNGGSGYVVKDDQHLKQFAVAAANGNYAWMQAEITGKKVIVWNDAFPNPFSVRYAWVGNP